MFCVSQVPTPVVLGTNIDQENLLPAKTKTGNKKIPKTETPIITLFTTLQAPQELKTNYNLHTEITARYQQNPQVTLPLLSLNVKQVIGKRLKSIGKERKNVIWQPEGRLLGTLLMDLEEWWQDKSLEC